MKMISNLDMIGRLLLAAALGSLIGAERERLAWTAGIRTHMLVCVGACLLMIVSAYGFENAKQMPHVVLDPSRIAAQVVSGVGFLGAGSILLRGNSIRGLTTAASIWAVAALGLAAGGGLYAAAGVTTVIILIILAGLKPLEDAYRARVQSCVLHVRAEHDGLSVDDLKRLLRIKGGQIQQHTQVPVEDGLDDHVLHLARVSRSDMRRGAQRLAEHAGVQAVEVQRRGSIPALKRGERA
ncbi:MgtC/SapB family protein [Sphingomonas sp. 2R-10]|uniref:MgtC/SapB family protein n=1 Tax=Sphingomonas sp. 2R-10 TaxID=3045148 RepID=UPI0024BB11CC|nr:MgtC/SapB family protein [Sphingomonas sp. 2R-10]